MNFNVTLTMKWGISNKLIHPQENAQTGTLVFALSAEKYKLFEVGTDASKGFFQLISNENKEEFITETYDSHKNEAMVLTSNPVKASIVNMKLAANQYQPYLSFVTMLSPLTDYFVGVSSVPLIEDNYWIKSVEIPLYPMRIMKSKTDETSRKISMVTGEPFYTESLRVPIAVGSLKIKSTF